MKIYTVAVYDLLPLAFVYKTAGKFVSREIISSARRAYLFSYLTHSSIIGEELIIVDLEVSLKG